jgi:uncharacterized repeat protein (TIGR03803 family)
MRGRTFFRGWRLALAIFTVTLLAINAWAAAQETVLHSFNDNGADGVEPKAGLISDAAGNLYGVTTVGGIHAAGSVFELSPREGGGWTETVLHSFGHGTDGVEPVGSLVRDAAGNLYGTTTSGGIHLFGTVFELSLRENGGWTESVLHSFNLNFSDGASPYSGLIFDAAGNLYGTTQEGGIHNAGTVFELSPREGGGWTEKVLHSFNYGFVDGAYPDSNLVLDAAGNLFGTTASGGVHVSGTVFELSPNDHGGWTETVLHSFGSGTDGYTPLAGLVFDDAGNLYGTTDQGGIHGWGTAFELMPSEDGSWAEKVLHSFNLDGLDGAGPVAGLIFDGAGNLYGTTVGGGIHLFGTVFELSPRGNGEWTEQVVHSFNRNGSDGAAPYAGLVTGAAGNFYGTTAEGGIHLGPCVGHGCGTVFEITP